MISGASIITSKKLSQEDYLQCLAEIENELSIQFVSKLQIIIDGKSNIWIRRSSANELDYTDEELLNFGLMLKGEPTSFIAFDYDDGEKSLSTLIEIVKIFGQKMPIILDSGYGNLHHPNDIADIDMDSF